MNNIQYKQSDFINILFYGLIIIMSLGIYVGYSVPAVLLVLLVLRSIVAEKKTVGVFLCLYGSILGGTIRFLYPWMPIYGVLFIVVGLFLIKDDVLYVVRAKNLGLLFLIATCLALAIAFLYGPRDKFAVTKIVMVCFNAIIYYISYKCFKRNKKFDVHGFAQLLFLSSIFYFVATKKALMLTGMNGLLDFNWYRSLYYDFFYQYGENIGFVSYQHIGNGALMGFVFSCSKKNFKWKDFLFSGFISCYLILISGSRQSLVGFAALLVLLLAVQLSWKPKFSILFLGFLTLLVLFFVFAKISSDALYLDSVSFTNEDDPIGRTLNYLTGIDLFRNNYLLGVGLGGYNQTGIGPYPHNIFIEVLCECGILGFSIVVGLLAIYLIHFNINYRSMTAGGSYYFLPFIPVFLSSMVSGDLKTTIVLFSIIYAGGYSKVPKQKKQIKTKLFH